MKIVVFGATGMLGQAVVQAAWKRSHSVTLPPRVDVDIAEPAAVIAALDANEAVVINCAGTRPAPDVSPVAMARANVVGPHVLASACAAIGLRLIHVSTDCVFGRGQCGRPTVRDTPAPDDLYGRMKLAGESEGEHVTNVRTSFIGPTHGLVPWLLGHRDGAEVPAWHRAWWAGSTVLSVADALVTLAERGDGRNIEHLATLFAVTKGHVLKHIAERHGRSVRFVAGGPAIHRALDPTIELPALEDAEWWV